MTAEIAKIIDDGLRWYEEELWHDRPATATVEISLILYIISNQICIFLE
jgi:hypothetical protein